MKSLKYLFLSLSCFALTACGINSTPEPEIVPSSNDPVSSETQSSEDSSSTISESQGSSSSIETTTSEEPKKEPLSTFDEINSKMDMVKKAIGATVSAEDNDSLIESAMPVLSAPSPKSMRIRRAPDPDPEYTESFNEGWKYSDLFEDFQTFDYIVNITNFLHNYMSNNSYETTLEYGKVYKSEGYMELTRSLNEAMVSNSFPAPTLSYVFTKTGNNLECFANWDYTSVAMKTYVPIWNMKILTHITYVFNDDKELEKVYVAYLFEGIQFQIASALFDFKNLNYYSFHAFNGSGEAPYDTDYDTAKVICDARYLEVSNGTITSDHLPLCSCVRATKINIGSTKMSTDDVKYIMRQTNARFEENRDDIVCLNTSLKTEFVSLFNEVQNKVKDNSFILNYNYGEPTVVNHIVEEGALYSIWRSVVIYNYDAKATILAYIDYDNLHKYITELKTTAEADVKTKLDGLLTALEASKDIFIGNIFKDNTDTYTLELSTGAYEQTAMGQTGSYYTFGEYCYALYKNETLITKFSIDKNGHAYINNSINSDNYCNVFLTDEGIELMKDKYLVVWYTDSNHDSGVTIPMLRGERKSVVSFETTKVIINVIIGVYTEEVVPPSFEEMVDTYDTYSPAPDNLDTLIWVHYWGTFGRSDFLESTKSNGYTYNNWMGVFDHVNNGYLDSH